MASVTIPRTRPWKRPPAGASPPAIACVLSCRLRLQDGGLERAAGLEARHARGGNPDDVARARVASVAGDPLAHHEGAEAADGDPSPLLERVEYAHEEGVEGPLRRHLAAARGLGHGGDEIGLGHDASDLLDGR